MARRIVIIAAAAAVLFAGCKISSASSPEGFGSMAGSSATAPASIDFKVVSTGVQRGIQGQQLRVVTTEKQFASLASMAGLSGSQPKVDFSKDEVIGVFLGSNVGCGTDGLKVKSVSESAATVTVHASRLVRKPNAKGGACTIMPLNGFSYVLISIPKTGKAISLAFD